MLWAATLAQGTPQNNAKIRCLPTRCVWCDARAGGAALVVAAAWVVAPVAGADILVLGHLPPEAGLDRLSDVAVFEMSGGQSYVLAAGDAGVYVFNVTDPLNLAMVGSVPHPDAYYIGAQTFRAPGGIPYGLVESHDDIRVFSLADPADPVPLDYMTDARDGTTHMENVLLVQRPDGSVYALGADRRTGDSLIVDVTDPLHPVPVSRAYITPLLPSCDGSAFVSGDGGVYAIYACHLGGAVILNATGASGHGPVATVTYGGDDGAVSGQAKTPELFRDTLVLDHIWSNVPDVRITDPHAAGLTHANGVETFGLSDGRTYAWIYSDALTHMDGPAAVHVTVPAGILFLDVTDPALPVPVGAAIDGRGGFDFGSHVRDVSFLGEYGGSARVAVAVARDVIIMDVANPRDPVPTHRIRDGEDGINAIDLVSGIDAFQSSGGPALAAVGHDGIQVVLLSNQSGFEATDSIPGDAPSLMASTGFVIFEPGDGRTYVFYGNQDSARIADVTDPGSLVPVTAMYDGAGGFEALNDIHGIVTFGAPDGRTYGVTVGWEGLYIMDVTDPPERLGGGRHARRPGRRAFHNQHGRVARAW